MTQTNLLLLQHGGTSSDPISPARRDGHRALVGSGHDDDDDALHNNIKKNKQSKEIIIEKGNDSVRAAQTDTHTHTHKINGLLLD